jgi:hypothetical protein
VFTSKQKQVFRRCAGGARKLQRRMSVVSIFVLLARAAGQDVGGNAATNQPGAQILSTNAAPIQNIVTPSPSSPDETNLLEAQSALTNQFGVISNQPPLLGPATVGSAEPLSPIMGTSALAGAPGPVGPVTVGPGIPLWGPIDIHPHFLYTFLYGDGLQAQPGQQSKTVINTFAPGFLLDFGQHWSIDYSPSFGFYSNPLFKNTTDESVLLRGNWTYEDWGFGLSQGYVSSTQPLIETGTQTAQEAYATALNASYQMGSKLSLQLGLNQNIRDASGAGVANLREWTTQDWLNYQEGTMFGMGIGLILGYDDLSIGSDMPYEQIQGRINYHPGPKLTLTLSGGAEDRQFTGPSAPSLISPIFSVALQYQICQPTTLSVAASRAVTPSFYANQIETVTSVGGSIRQQLSKKFSLEADVGYTSEPQTSIVPGPLAIYYIGQPTQSTLEVVNHDTVTSYRISLSYAVVDRATLSVFYSLSDNSSSQVNYAYTSKQFGLSFSWRY